jgi:acylphosphatase
MSASPAAEISVRVRIEGRVQGVGFRAFVEREARRLKLAGWVRNRRDGAVEASFRGPAGVVDMMVESCKTGPKGASVARVSVREDDEPPPDGFSVKPTM